MHRERDPVWTLEMFLHAAFRVGIDFSPGILQQRRPRKLGGGGGGGGGRRERDIDVDGGS